MTAVSSRPELTDSPRLQLFECGQSELKDFEETHVSETDRSLSVLRQSSTGRGNVEFIYELIENLESKYTVIHGCLQKLLDIVGQFSMNRVVKPAKFGNAADKLDQTGHDKILQLRSVVGKIREDVVANVNALRYREGVPVCRDEFGEGVGGDQSGKLRLGVVQNILTLWNVLGGLLEAHESLLRLVAADLFTIFARGGHARVERLA